MAYIILKKERVPKGVVTAYTVVDVDKDISYLKIMVRGKLRLITFSDKMGLKNQVDYLDGVYSDFVMVGNWRVSISQVRSWEAKGKSLGGERWVVSFNLAYESSSRQIIFNSEDEYIREVEKLDELFKTILK